LFKKTVIPSIPANADDPTDKGKATMADTSAGIQK
jgi:hypothetical protein